MFSGLSEMTISHYAVPCISNIAPDCAGITKTAIFWPKECFSVIYKVPNISSKSIPLQRALSNLRTPFQIKLRFQNFIALNKTSIPKTSLREKKKRSPNSYLLYPKPILDGCHQKSSILAPRPKSTTTTLSHLRQSHSHSPNHLLLQFTTTHPNLSLLLCYLPPNPM